MNISEKALMLHEQWNGKLEVVSKVPVKSREDLSIAYTPGVAEPCKVIAQDKEAAYKYTMKANTVAVVSDGSAVLGLGNIGPYAAMPVMEGKAVLFKEFGGVNAVPICLDTQDTEEIIKAVTYLAPAYGGINLEDISAPRCFEIEERLKEILDIPVFHDDQHGTAIVVLAGIINALKVVGKKKEDVKIVFNGIGAAGGASAKLLLDQGFSNMILCDKDGILCEGDADLPPHHAALAARTNREHQHGTLADALVGADVFIGVSRPGLVTGEMVERMAKDTGTTVRELMQSPERRKAIRLSDYVTDKLGLPTLTDIMKEGSDMLIASDDPSVVEKAFGKKPEGTHVWLDGVMSRKKQVVPPLQKVMK